MTSISEYGIQPVSQADVVFLAQFTDSWLRGARFL